MKRARLQLLLLAVLAGAVDARAADVVTVGSKNFTESYVLAEVVARLLEANGFTVHRRTGLGGTLPAFEALRTGAIDVYPEYTGTINRTILGREGAASFDDVAQALRAMGLTALPPLGFDNSYALVVSTEVADAYGLRTISDLAGHPDLRLGFSHEFRQRPDGWPGLAAAYRLQAKTLGIEHGLAYQALAEGDIDVTDAYTTDGKLTRFRLRMLDDDRRYFPPYEAVLVAHVSDARVLAILKRLSGRLDDVTMRALNARVDVDGEDIAAVASDFLRDAGLADTGTDVASDRTERLLSNTLRHLQLTALALAFACIIGGGGGLVLYRLPRASRIAVYVAGLLQTIPSIALLALMIPFLGIGVIPAVVALTLYSLLPILRSTITALLTVDPLLRRVAAGMGLTRGQQMRHVFLPLALPHVLAGVRTAAVICIGTATLAAFIGAGGLGQPIVTGLATNRPALILEGAIPAAVLAVCTELAFEVLERWLVPRHLVSR